MDTRKDNKIKLSTDYNYSLSKEQLSSSQNLILSSEEKQNVLKTYLVQAQNKLAAELKKDGISFNEIDENKPSDALINFIDRQLESVDSDFLKQLSQDADRCKMGANIFGFLFTPANKQSTQNSSPYTAFKKHLKEHLTREQKVQLLFLHIGWGQEEIDFVNTLAFESLHNSRDRNSTDVNIIERKSSGLTLFFDQNKIIKRTLSNGYEIRIMPNKAIEMERYELNARAETISILEGTEGFKVLTIGTDSKILERSCMEAQITADELISAAKKTDIFAYPEHRQQIFAAVLDAAREHKSEAAPPAITLSTQGKFVEAIEQLIIEKDQANGITSAYVNLPGLNQRFCCVMHLHKTHIN